MDGDLATWLWITLVMVNKLSFAYAGTIQYAGMSRILATYSTQILSAVRQLGETLWIQRMTPEGQRRPRIRQSSSIEHGITCI